MARVYKTKTGNHEFYVGSTKVGSFNSDGTATALGMNPLGAVIAIMPHLPGAYNCTATTAADASGFVVCGGQTISDPTSPMNGAVIPNINNDVFLMGTAGTVNGSIQSSNTKDLSHTHSVTASVAISAHSVTNNAVTSGGSGALSHSVTNNAVTSVGSGALSHSVTNNAVTSLAGGSHSHSIPAHYHALGTGADLNITSSGSASVSGTTDIGHTHGSSTVSGTIGSDGTHIHTTGAYNVGTGVGATALTIAGTGYSVPSTDSSHSHTFSLTAGGHTLAPSNISLSSGTAANHTHATGNISGRIGLVTGGVDGNAAMISGPENAHTHSVTSNVAVGDHASHTHSVTSNVAVGDHTSHTHSVTSNVTVENHTLTPSATTSTAALSSSFDIRPKYIACKYVMRIK